MNGAKCLLIYRTMMPVGTMCTFLRNFLCFFFLLLYAHSIFVFTLYHQITFLLIYLYISPIEIVMNGAKSLLDYRRMIPLGTMYIFA